MDFSLKSLVIDIGLILLLGFLAITWFRGNNLISGGDMGLPLDRLKYLNLMRYSWDETYAMGAANPRQLASLIPYALWGGITEVLGLSLIFWEKSLFYIWFAGTGLSMYYLCRVFKMDRVGRLAASIFYMFNPFSLMIVWRVSHGLVQMPYTFAPLVLGLYINGLKKKRGFRYIVFAVLLWLLATTSAYAWPVAAVIHWLLIGFYFLGALIFQPDNRRFILKFSLLFLVVWILFNFYWFLPFIISISESIVSAHMPALMSDIETTKLNSVKFVDAVRMLGYWSVKTGYKGDPYYPYWQFYESLWIKLISHLIPILVVLGLVNEKIRRSRQTLFFFLGFIILGLIGINGAYPPLGGLFLWVFRLLPPLGLFTRFNFMFFGLPTYLLFSVLLGYGFSLIHNYGFKKIKNLIFVPLVILAVLLNVVLVLPFWTGEVIRAEGKSFPGERFQVPDYWWEAKGWLTGQKEFFRILPLPMSKTYNVAFDWGEGYTGGDPTRWLTNQPTLNTNTGDTFEVPMLIGEAIEKETVFKDVAKLLGFLNTKYLLVRNDTIWEFLKGHNWWFQHRPDNIEKFVKNQEGLTLEKEIGELLFYRLDDKFLLPHIYAPSVVKVIDGEVGSLLDTAQFLRPEEGESFIVTKQNENKNALPEPDFIWRRPSFTKTEGIIDLTRPIYEIQVDVGGKYELLLRDSDFLRFYQSEELKLMIDDGPVQERNLVPAGDNLISFGEVELSAGAHRIIIFPSPTINLVDNPSFEEDVVGQEYSEDAFEGSRSLKVPAAGIVSIPILDFELGETYSFSFVAKYLQGGATDLVFWENYSDSPTPIFKTTDSPFGAATVETNFSQFKLRPISSWGNFEIILNPSSGVKSVGVAFMSPRKSENLVDNLKVQRVFNNPLTLKNVSKSVLPLAVPEVSFKKISPVKYEVEIGGAKEPFWLIFSEAFHPDWISSVEGERLMMNGFANGWHVKKLGDYKITLFFKPQRTYYLGAAVSLLTFITSLGFVCLNLLKKNHLRKVLRKA